MDDHVEEMLKVDAFRQAVRRDKDALDRLFVVRSSHVSDTIATLVRRENARHSSDGQFGECLA